MHKISVTVNGKVIHNKEYDVSVSPEDDTNDRHVIEVFKSMVHSALRMWCYHHPFEDYQKHIQHIWGGDMIQCIIDVNGYKEIYELNMFCLDQYELIKVCSSLVHYYERTIKNVIE